VSATFPETARFVAAMDRLGIRFVPLHGDAAAGSGARWRQYREQGGSRERVVADLLVGAHAAHQADRLLTRDRGFFRRYFDDLMVLDPSREVPLQRR